jgi:RimJ/RimL family protein N-acetyltransferase
MVASTRPIPVTYLAQRSITILRKEGPTRLVRRIMDCLQSHRLVYGNKNCAELLMPICEVELEFKEITAADGDEIDELTAADEWHIPKSFTLRRLEEGEHIYIAKHKGRIVASVSIVTKDKFRDPFSIREFNIAPNEAYYWRGFCVPAFRGRGIVPVILTYSMKEMALKYGRNNALALILTANKSSLRMLSKIGFVKVGRGGFFEIFGFSFHYLWGREAFKETRQRFLIQKT